MHVLRREVTLTGPFPQPQPEWLRSCQQGTAERQPLPLLALSLLPFWPPLWPAAGD